MRKIKLSLDRLKVESFDTDDARGARGTVGGHSAFPYDPFSESGGEFCICPNLKTNDDPGGIC